jgi:diadenosine tetraphosphate (Ap4A) HIT family hydrolase
MSCADKFPVSPGHLLILTHRHVAEWFETTPAERLAILALADAARTLIMQEFAPDGFNLGVNISEAAGQTISYVHLISRYRGDVDDLRGGMRAAVISTNAIGRTAREWRP